MGQSIMVIDDDPKIRGLLRNVFEGEGFVVHEAASATDVLKRIAEVSPSLITLDIHLGSENGLEVAKDIRRVSNTPIIMVTGKDDVIDRVVGLEVGADDYITKPFHVREVIARVKTVLRRSAPTQSEDVTAPTADALPDMTSPALRFDGLTAFMDQLELRDRNGADCHLSTGDFKLLKIFLERPKRALSRDQLMDLIGGIEWSPLDRTVDNQIARLRKKIERDPSNPKIIKTVRGVGYILACDVTVLQPSDVSAKSA